MPLERRFILLEYHKLIFSCRMRLKPADPTEKSSVTQSDHNRPQATPQDNSRVRVNKLCHDNRPAVYLCQ